jgi:hypothetical protein
MARRSSHREEEPTLAQLEVFLQWKLDPPPTVAACDATMDYIIRGFPFDGKLTQDERIQKFRNTYAEWVGKRVTVQLSGGMRRAEGRVTSIRGQGVRMALLGGHGVGRSPFVAVVYLADGSPFVQKNLDQLTKIAE